MSPAQSASQLGPIPLHIYKELASDTAGYRGFCDS